MINKFIQIIKWIKKITKKPKNNALNSGENQNENNNEINGKNQLNDFDINSLKTVKEPTVINTMNQPDTNQNIKEEPKIDNYKESAVTNPFFTKDKNPFDNTLGESNILPQIENPNPNQLESSQQQNNDLNDNVDPFSKVEEVSTIIPKKEQNILNDSEINNDPFATKIDTIIQSDINLNNNEQKNDNKNISPLVSNNPLYIEAHNNQNQNLLNNIQTDSNISSQDNNNDNNIINNVENQFKNISIGNNQNVFGETTESIINDSQKLNENNNNINQNQSNNNMAYDEEEEKIDFASKIESFNTNQNKNQQHISVPSFTDIISKEKMNNDNNNNNQNA